MPTDKREGGGLAPAPEGQAEASAPAHPGAPPSGGPPAPRVTVAELLAHPEICACLTLRAGAAGVGRFIAHQRVQKSGLVLAKHSQGVVPWRIQVLGEMEISYLESLPESEREERVAFMLEMGMSLIVVTRGVEPPAPLVAHAERTETPLAVASMRSSTTINQLHAVLDRVLAPRTRLHGVFVVVHGVGILLTGASGIGKSECALFLVERGHRLVADDQVELVCLPNSMLVGAPMPLLKHHLEIRGLGILNIRDLFGATAVRDEARVDLVVELCSFRDDEPYERLGLDDQRIELLGASVARLRIPVRPGRDMAVILEISARNHLLKREGLHSARRFAERLDRELFQQDKKPG